MTFALGLPSASFKISVVTVSVSRVVVVVRPPDPALVESSSSGLSWCSEALSGDPS